jgi:hypothetical protein
MKTIFHHAGKWAVIGIVFAVIVVAAPPREGGLANTVSSSAASGASSTAPSRAGQPVSEAVRVELERLAKTKPESGVEFADVFGATSWYEPPPPPPPMPPAPPPPPTAPPLPFTYLGLYEDAPTRLTILVKGDRMYTVSEGDVIENTYRIERVTPGLMELTYLPLNIKQSLRTGETL